MNKQKIYTSHQKLSADILTPVQLFLKIRDKYEKPLLLESSEHSNKTNDYTYICFQPLFTFSHENGSYFIDGKPIEHRKNLKEQITDYISLFETEAYPFPFTYNGLFGYTGYHAIPLFEKITFSKTSEQIPTLFYALYQYVLVVDHYHDELHLFTHHTNQQQASENLENITNYLLHKPINQYSFSSIGDEQPEINDDDFTQLVKKAKEHCKKGDVFQIVLSRKFSQQFKGDEFNIYRALRNINPSPYLFYFDYGNFRLFGSSPESQVIIKNKEVTIHPIAGTVKRSGDLAADLHASDKLKQDPKENAEHVMLVDLARNDISKHASDVYVNYYKQLHQYSHVIHMVSEVKGKLKPKYHSYNALLDTFPAGTLSGAPKHKAMQLIHSYEKSSRSFYGGSIGIIDFNNQTHHAIIIRSFLSKNNVLHYQAGAGIVVSSIEENELQEVNNKISALRKAIQYANQLNPTN